MDRNETFFSMIMIIAGQLPMVLVWLVGLIMAIVRWGRHPRVSSFVLIAVFISAGTSFGSQIVYRLLPGLVETGDISRLFPLVSVCSSILYAVAWGCMLLAVFSDRSSASSGSPFGQQYDLPTK